ncbi:MAG: membrane protein insertase YidC [Christensenellaceae bacterium]|nr:membrane protein insertase YidC [Christensenellaceae bacterium]
MTGDFFLTEWFFYLVRWLYSVLGNSYFLTILIITLTLRLVQVFPDIKSRRSQRKQAALQPEIDKLQKKYANNPQKLREEQSKLMKEQGVSMLSGCLPMLLTLPIFFCFLAAFRFWGYEQTIKLTYETVVDANNGSVADMNDTRSQRTFDSFDFAWITNIWQPDSGFAPVVPTASNVKRYGKVERLVIFSKGYDTIDGEHVDGETIWNTFVENGLAEGEFGSDDMVLLSTEDSQKKYDELMARYDTGYNNGWFILPIFAAVFQFLAAWVSQRQSKKLNPAAAAQQGSMNFMLWMFPIMSIMFCLSSTSAFALYWVFSSIFQLASSSIVNYIISKEDVSEIVVK